MEFMGVAGVAAIGVIAYLIGEAVKISPADNKYIPVICGTAGALLGVAAMYTVPEFPAGDIINAIAVGIVSGLSATGADQIAKQMKKIKIFAPPYGGAKCKYSFGGGKNILKILIK